MAQHEDVYETSDLPESEQVIEEKQEKFDSEHIASIQLNVGAAFQRFKGNYITGDNVDFSDSVSHRRRKGYGGGSYVLELIGSEDKPESIEERYNRLQQELIELDQDLGKIKKSEAEVKSAAESGAKVTPESVGELQKQLKQLQLEQILGQSSSALASDPAFVQKLEHSIETLKHQKPKKKDAKTEGDKASYEMFINPSSSPVAKLNELEARLSKMENLVGYDTDKLMALTGGSRNRGMVDVVEMLQQKIQLLDPNHLDGLETRFNVVISKLNAIAEKKKEGDGNANAHVNEVYEMMKKWDGFCSTLPDLVARMQALQDLHEQALQFSQSLTQLDAIQQQLVKSLEVDGKLLQEAQSNFTSNMEIMQKSCKSIDERMKNLKK